MNMCKRLTQLASNTRFTTRITNKTHLHRAEKHVEIYALLIKEEEKSNEALGLFLPKSVLGDKIKEDKNYYKCSYEIFMAH